VEPAPRSQEGSNAVYRQAEAAYSLRDYEKAADLYVKYLATSPPDHPLADSAYFKIGMCWFELKRYKEGLYFFNTIISRFPTSQNRSEALVNAAISMFHLNDLKAAEEVFDQALNKEANQGVRAYILYYKGAIAEKRLDYNTAARFYIQAGLTSANEDLLLRAKVEVDRIFANFIDEKQLEDVRGRYKGQWPAGLAVSALAKLYSASGQGEKLAAARAELNQYPRLLPAIAATPDEPSAEDNYRPKDIKIGVALPLSGSGGGAGLEMIQGIQLAMNSFLKLMREKNIQLVVKDTGAGDGSEKALAELAADRDALVILGPAYSDEFKKAAPIADKARIPIISPSATEEGMGALSRLLFRTALTNSVEARRMADMAVRTMGLRKFVIIYGADRQGRELAQYFTQEVERLGGQALVAEAYTLDQNDFGPQIKKIGGISDPEEREIILAAAKGGGGVEVINSHLARAYADKLGVPSIVSYKKAALNAKNFLPGLTLKYDAVYLPGMYDKVGLILPQLEFYNIKGVAKLASSGANHHGLVRIAEKYADGLIFLDGFFAGASAPRVQAFVKDYRLFFRSEPTILSAQAYDAATVALSAIAQGAGTRFELAAALRSLSHFEGVTGEMSMAPEGEMDKTPVFLTVEAGKITEMSFPSIEPAGAAVAPSPAMEPRKETVNAPVKRP
jgi:ABC-type branched-subunit amino acid transport system substrate-binding protein